MRQGCLGGSVCEVANFSSGHDLVVHGFEPRVGLCAAQSLEPTSDSMSPSLSVPPLLMRSVSLSKINRHLKKIFLNVISLLNQTYVFIIHEPLWVYLFLSVS